METSYFGDGSGLWIPAQANEAADRTVKGSLNMQYTIDGEIKAIIKYKIPEFRQIRS